MLNNEQDKNKDKVMTYMADTALGYNLLDAKYGKRVDGLNDRQKLLMAIYASNEAFVLHIGSGDDEHIRESMVNWLGYGKSLGIIELRGVLMNYDDIDGIYQEAKGLTSKFDNLLKN